MSCLIVFNPHVRPLTSLQFDGMIHMIIGPRLSYGWYDSVGNHADTSRLQVSPSVRALLSFPPHGHNTKRRVSSEQKKNTSTLLLLLWCLNMIAMRPGSPRLEGNSETIYRYHLLSSPGTFLLSFILIVVTAGRTLGVKQTGVSCNEGFVSILKGERCN